MAGVTNSRRLFDHRVRQREHFVRYRKPERLGGYEIDDQIEFGRLPDRKLSGAVSESRGYSITSSARVRNDSESANPSAFAALRFTISSNLVGN